MGTIRMTIPMRVLIADDELPARKRLRALLKRHADVEVIGECSHGEETYEGTRDLRPDVLLLDVQMPDCDAFTLLQRLPAEERPVIIFVTAHVDFAFDAFEAAAADFVLKPFENERFDRALDRARKMVVTAAAASGKPSPRRTRFVIRRRGDIIILSTDEIDWIASEGNYVRLHVGAKSYLVREAMQKLDESLGPSFIRAHRSAIVNVARVERMTSGRAGGTVLQLVTGTSIPVGPLYRQHLTNVLSSDAHEG